MRFGTPIACLLVLALAGCSPPEPPEEERRPEPQAGGTQAQPTSTIVQTADAYKDAARAAVANSEQAAAKEKAALDAATQ